MQEIYLDNSATTKPLPAVHKAIKKTLTQNYGNPSSLHRKGLAAEKIIKNTRKIIAEKLKTESSQIYFTSGGTESNNLALKGIAYAYQNRGKHLITTKIEHPSVFNVFKTLEEEGFKVTYLDPDHRGRISLEKLKNSLTSETILVSMMQVNNEIGTIQPVKKAGSIIKNYNENIFLHVDAVQALGKILIRPRKWNIDLLSISGHKIHGPKGIGALYINNPKNMKPLLEGGGQENNLRSGTENVPGIAGLKPAITHLPDFNQNNGRNQQLDKLKNEFLKKLKENIPEARINTPTDFSAPHIVNMSFPGIKGEVLVHALEEDNIYVSTGSACNSRKEKTSNVLKAIEVPDSHIEGTIRVSFSRFNTLKDINIVLDKLQEKLEFLKI